MLLVFAIAVVSGFAALAFHYWDQLHGSESSLEPAPFFRWLSTGLIIPSLCWLILNMGWLPAFPPLIPDIALAQSARRSWLAIFSPDGAWIAGARLHLGGGILWAFGRNDNHPCGVAPRIRGDCGG